MALLWWCLVAPSTQGQTVVGDIEPKCPPPFAISADKKSCSIATAELGKLTTEAACTNIEGLQWVAKAESKTCTVVKAPQPKCLPAAWNVVFKDGKCVIETVSTQSKDFFANWAIGVAVVRPAVRSVIEAAIVPAAAASGATPTVRVNSEVRHESALLVARHFYPGNPGRRCAQDGRFSVRESDDNWDGVKGFFSTCVGAMVAVGLPTSGAANGQVINFAGLGLALGSGPAMQDSPLAWHLGFGWGRKFNTRVLGDGWTENAAPPPGETQVRYKNIDVPARFLYFTVHW